MLTEPKGRDIHDRKTRVWSGGMGRLELHEYVTPAVCREAAMGVGLCMGPERQASLLSKIGRPPSGCPPAAGGGSAREYRSPSFYSSLFTAETLGQIT